MLFRSPTPPLHPSSHPVPRPHWGLLSWCILLRVKPGFPAALVVAWDPLGRGCGDPQTAQAPTRNLGDGRPRVFRTGPPVGPPALAHPLPWHCRSGRPGRLRAVAPCCPLGAGLGVYQSASGWGPSPCEKPPRGTAECRTAVLHPRLRGLASGLGRDRKAHV